MKYKKRIEKLETMTRFHLRYRLSVPGGYYKSYLRFECRISDLIKELNDEAVLIPNLDCFDGDVPEDMALIEAIRAGGEVPKETIERIKVTHFPGENLICVGYGDNYDQECTICSKNDWKEPSRSHRNAFCTLSAGACSPS